MTGGFNLDFKMYTIVEQPQGLMILTCLLWHKLQMNQILLKKSIKVAFSCQSN